MQKYINLINFLKENDENIKKDLEELRFGTEIKTNYHYGKIINVRKEYNQIIFFDNTGNAQVIDYDYKDLKIIGNNLDYHHIMMYFKKIISERNIGIEYDSLEEDIFITTFGEIIHYIGKIGKHIKITKIDNTKPLHEQKSEVYKALLDYFVGLQ